MKIFHVYLDAPEMVPRAMDLSNDHYNTKRMPKEDIYSSIYDIIVEEYPNLQKIGENFLCI